MSLQRLFNLIENYAPGYDQKLLERAYYFAQGAHLGQYRNSGEEYINHPVEVACILAEMELDLTTIIGGLLHDVVEDTRVTLEEVAAQFGPEVSFLVRGDQAGPDRV